MPLVYQGVGALGRETLALANGPPCAENDYPDGARFGAGNGPRFHNNCEVTYWFAIQSDAEQAFKFGAAWRGS